MNPTKLDLEILENIKTSHSADDWADYMNIWSNSRHFPRPEWRLFRLCDLGFMEKKLVKVSGWYDWRFRLKGT